MNDEKPVTLLLVDDEPNILRALTRALRPLGMRVVTAANGREGLERLAEERVELIISDMRMPEMDGAEFLKQAAERAPDTIRILLTGYADLSSTIAAVNQGRIYRYLSKPWEDNDLRITVQHALERHRLEQEQRRLTLLIHRRNKELQELNEALEARVQERTAKIRLAAEHLQRTHRRLEESFSASIHILSHLASSREGGQLGAQGSHSRRVAEQAREIGEMLGLNEEQARTVYHAGLLHDIGKLGLPDRLIARPFEGLSPEERKRVAAHPLLGQAALLALDALEPAAALIRAHHERWDGGGYPDGLAGEEIPLGARILAVPNEYDALLLGTLRAEPFTPEQARDYIERESGRRYDPRVVEMFLMLWNGEERKTAAAPITEVALTSGQLTPEMELSRDLFNHHGLMLLPKGRRLDLETIAKILKFERDEGQPYTLHVRNPEYR
ncbi:HD domain-containing phosphohydrolase [Endothiovibrio diazotrophicus]